MLMNAFVYSLQFYAGNINNLILWEEVKFFLPYVCVGVAQYNLFSFTIKLYSSSILSELHRVCLIKFWKRSLKGKSVITGNRTDFQYSTVLPFHSH